jgi:hypothetical protein
MTTNTCIAPNQRAIEILVGTHKLRGFLNIPSNAKGIVVFALHLDEIVPIVEAQLGHKAKQDGKRKRVSDLQ